MRSMHARFARLKEEQSLLHGAPTSHSCCPCHLHPWLPQKLRGNHSLLWPHSVCGTGTGHHVLALVGLLLTHGPSGSPSLGPSRTPGLCLLTGLQPWGLFSSPSMPTLWVSHAHSLAPPSKHPLSTDLPWRMGRSSSQEDAPDSASYLGDCCTPNCVPPKFIHWRPNPQVDCIWRQEGNGSYIRS